MYRVVVEKGNLRFSAAHFISFGGKCERLHGHNYGVSVELEGELTEDRYVFDFVVLKRIVQRIEARAKCRSCGNEFTQQMLFSACNCGSHDVERLSGEELKIRNMNSILPLPRKRVARLDCKR